MASVRFSLDRIVFVTCVIPFTSVFTRQQGRRIRLTIRGFIPYNEIANKSGGVSMPTISHFYGIIIVMYLRNKEHNPPHIHAITQDFDAPFLIETGEIMEGEFPPKAKALVKEFVLKYQKELNQMWVTEQYIKLPPLA
jgi:hypothetical protein